MNIEEYLNSSDRNMCRIGFELLRQSNMPKSKRYRLLKQARFFYVCYNSGNNVRGWHKIFWYTDSLGNYSVEYYGTF